MTDKKRLDDETLWLERELVKAGWKRVRLDIDE